MTTVIIQSISKEMSDVAVIESIVDGLACIFEPNKPHTSIEEWIGCYNPCRYTHEPNRTLAAGVLKALKSHINLHEYEQLKVFRKCVFAILRESVPWGPIETHLQCFNTYEKSETRDLSEYFQELSV